MDKEVKRTLKSQQMSAKRMSMSFVVNVRELSAKSLVISHLESKSIAFNMRNISTNTDVCHV
jgi:hypothetical protein